MCGIIGFTGKSCAAPILLEGLKRLEYRGYDSVGIAVFDNTNISVRKGTGRVKKLCELTNNGSNLRGTSGIGHTRWATHGVPTDENAHPHLSNNGKFAVVHNGIIENYVLLKDELLENGYKFKSETDTEVIANLIEKYYNGDIQAALIKAVSRLKGSYALGVICQEKPNSIYIARKASPLIIGVGPDGNYFASDITALAKYTDNVIYLDDGEFAELTSDSLSIFNSLSKTIEKRIVKIKCNINSIEKGNYDHFMLKEIMEQSTAVQETIKPRIKNKKVIFNELNLSSEDIKNVHKIIITGCGSAYYAGCSGKYVIEKLCRIPVETELASELRYNDPIIDNHTLLIGISQSGETADTISAMKECKSRGAKTIAIVNVESSSISKIADYTIYTYAGPEIAVATTKGFTTQLSILYLLSVYFSNKLGYTSDCANLLEEIESLPEQIENTIKMNSSILNLAKEYKSSQYILFIGRNTDYAVSLEAALKMKEISYLHSEAYAAGELKHGTIALIEKDQPVIALCCNSQIIEKTIGNIMEVKSRGGKILVLTTQNNKDLFPMADDLLFIPNTNTLFSAITEIIPLQLFAYYVARENGCDIDKPKNLAKSVTVE